MIYNTKNKTPAKHTKECSAFIFESDEGFLKLQHLRLCLVQQE